VELLDSVIQRPVIIALAITGALLATFGSYTKTRDGDTGKSRRLIILGYAITALSMVLFIIAGFRSAYV